MSPQQPGCCIRDTAKSLTPFYMDTRRKQPTERRARVSEKEARRLLELAEEALNNGALVIVRRDPVSGGLFIKDYYTRYRLEGATG